MIAKLRRDTRMLIVSGHTGGQTHLHHRLAALATSKSMSISRGHAPLHCPLPPYRYRTPRGEVEWRTTTEVLNNHAMKVMKIDTKMTRNGSSMSTISMTKPASLPLHHFHHYLPLHRLLRVSGVEPAHWVTPRHALPSQLPLSAPLAVESNQLFHYVNK